VLEAKGRAHGGIVGAASGGIRSGLTLVGEGGPELADLPPGTMVHPAGTTREMLAGGGMPTSVEARLHMPPGLERGLVRMLMEALRLEIKAVAGSGPNSVQRALT
jgi:hypothetical protein